MCCFSLQLQIRPKEAKVEIQRMRDVFMVYGLMVMGTLTELATPPSSSKTFADRWDAPVELDLRRPPKKSPF